MVGILAFVNATAVINLSWFAFISLYLQAIHFYPTVRNVLALLVWGAGSMSKVLPPLFDKHGGTRRRFFNFWASQLHKYRDRYSWELATCHPQLFPIASMLKSFLI